MTTLNARANQAWRDAAGGEFYTNAGFGSERAAFEEGWETGYKTARAEVAEEIAQALEIGNAIPHITASGAAKIAREIGSGGPS